MNFIDLKRETFSDKIDQTFVLDSGEEKVDLKLTQLTELDAIEKVPGAPEDLREEPFTLLFRGEGESILPQQLYSIHHESLGDFTLFITPVGADPEGVYYESVVN